MHDEMLILGYVDVWSMYMEVCYVYCPRDTCHKKIQWRMVGRLMHIGTMI
ncbi:hypothetical protein Syun_001841 [Stephania yunnanensis]|uniref:Uncharacterized protein n=1 Tax=Stephania yunnanensis TaxID=152371 RepID=A0AAP0LEN5_9MAGN